MATRKLEVEITGNPKKAVAALKELGYVAGDTEKTFSQKLSGIGDKMSSLGSTLTKTVTLPIVGAFGASFAAFTKQQDAEAKMDSQLNATGATAWATSQQMKDLASSLQDVTTFGDETTLSAEAILLSFTDVKNAGDGLNAVFDRTVAVAQDVSTVMGTDLNSTTVQLGKALNDPIAGLGGLSRAGIQFSESQKDMIKFLVFTGQKLEAQKLILGELENQYGGAAKAVAETSGGKLKQAMNRLGDAAEKLGASVAPIIEKLAGWLTTLSLKFQGLSPAARTAIVVIGGVVAAIGPLLLIGGKTLRAVSDISKAWKKLNEVMELSSLGPWALVVAAIAAVVAGLIWAYNNVDWFRNAVDAAWDWIQKVFWAAWDKIQPVLQALWSWITETLIPSFQALWQDVQQVWSGIWNAIQVAWPKIVAVFQAIWSWITGTLIPGFQALWQGIQQVVDAIVDYLVNHLWPSMQRVWGEIMNVVHAVGAAFYVLWSDWVQPVWELIQREIDFAWNDVIQPVWAAIQWYISNVLAPEFNILKDVVSAVWNVISSVISWAWNNLISPTFQQLKDGIAAVASFFSDHINQIIGFFSQVGSAILLPFQVAFRAIRQLWNSTIGGFSFTTPDWLPYIGGASFTIPKMHTGGIFQAPTPGGEGLALLKDGERVIPAGQTQGQGGDTYYVTVNSYGSTPTDFNRLIVGAIAEAKRRGQRIPTLA